MSDSTIEQGGFLANAVCVEDDAAADSTAFHGCVDHDCLVNRAASATTGRYVAENLDRTPLCCDVTPVAEGNPPCADNNANTAGAEGGAGLHREASLSELRRRARMSVPVNDTRIFANACSGQNVRLRTRASSTYLSHRM